MVPTERHQQILADLLHGETRPDVANDAHLAALAIEHELAVRWENPLAHR